MRVTTEGQVIIPQHIRDKLGIAPHSEVEFVLEGDKVILIKKETDANPFRHLRGAATVKMTTDEIMALTRGDS